MSFVKLVLIGFACASIIDSVASATWFNAADIQDEAGLSIQGDILKAFRAGGGGQKDGSGYPKVSLICQLNIDPNPQGVKAKGPCDPNPCLYGGNCTAKGEADFTCKCPVFMDGKKCADVVQKNCTVSEPLGKVICLYNNEGLSLVPSRADKKCKADGFDGSVMIKNAEMQQFVAGYLDKHLKVDPRATDYSMGIIKNPSTGLFEYVDGTPLGSYNAWNGGNVPNNICAELQKPEGQTAWQWGGSFCFGNYKFICEKTLIKA